MKEDEIECLYIYLCRGKFSSKDEISDKEIKSMLQGIHSYNLLNLFKE
jgi:hypothetical protein